MDWQSACSLRRNQAPWVANSSFQAHIVSPLCSPLKNLCRGHVGVAREHVWTQDKLKLKWTFRSKVLVSAYSSSHLGKLNFSRGEMRDVRINAYGGSEPFRGKPGSVSFQGLTHQSVEESKLVSAPFEENKGSFIWVFAPVALISSFMIPRFFIGDAIEELVKNELLSEIIFSFFSEIVFYIGLATFLRVTDHVQKPYLQFSAKRWSLITGLRGYLTSAYFAMGFKVIAPLFVVYVTWPSLGLPALVSVAPFLLACLVQFVFERLAQSRGSSSWPLVPILFEVYRINQLTRAVNFIQRLLYSTKEAPVTARLLEKKAALISMVVAFQILGVLCLWTLLTFLLRLFPSRPVAENY